MSGNPSRAYRFLHSSFVVVIAGAAGLTMIEACTIDTGGTPDECARDTTAGCSDDSVGFSCSGGRNPEQGDASLTCSDGVARGSDTVYCCADSTTVSCGQDSSVTCTGGSTGYSCDGSETPEQVDSTLTCGAGVTGVNGEIDYCCTTGSIGTCAADSTVSGCDAASAGYSCTGTDSPSDSDPSLSCSAGTLDGTDTLYCCSSTGSGTCAEDPTVAGCTGGSIGYSCLGTDTPEESNPSLTCGAGVADNGETLYCCTQ